MGKRRRDRTHQQTFHSKEPSSSEIEDSANLPDPDVIAAEIVEDLQAALAEFAEIASDSENAVHTAHSQLCSPKAHRAQDQPGSATPATDTGVRIRVLPRRITNEQR